MTPPPPRGSKNNCPPGRNLADPPLSSRPHAHLWAAARDAVELVAAHDAVELEVAAHDAVELVVSAHHTLELVAAHDAVGHVLADLEVRVMLTQFLI